MVWLMDRQGRPKAGSQAIAIQGNADQLMNSYLTPQNIALGVMYLRNSRAITCDTRLDGNILSRNLLRTELISVSLTLCRVIQHISGTI